MDKKDLHTNSLSEKQLKELREKNPDIRIPDTDLKLEDGFNKELIKSITNIKPEKSLKELKKMFKLTDTDIAEIFNYKNVLSYRNSTAKDKIETAIERLYVIFAQADN